MKIMTFEMREENMKQVKFVANEDEKNISEQCEYIKNIDVSDM